MIECMEAEDVRHGGRGDVRYNVNRGHENTMLTEEKIDYF